MDIAKLFKKNQPMKKFTLLFLLLTWCFSQTWTQGIFDAAIHTAVPYGDVNSPPNEDAQMIIDQDPNTKFLDFNELDGMGFEVDLLGVSVAATTIEFVTANDAPERDPTDFEIFGSNDGVNYTSIATGVIPCIEERFLSRTFQFSNTIAFSFYRVNFTGTCNPSSINQVADVQLYSTIGNAPTLVCSGDIIIPNTVGECGGETAFDVLAEDIEDGELTPTQISGPPAGGTFPIGGTAVAFSATDSDGNTVSCSFTITVEDIEDPVFDCPSDIVVNVDPGTTEVVVDYEISASDNCSVINPLDNYTPLGTLDGKSYHLSNNAYIAEEAYLFAGGDDGFVGTIRNEEDNEFLQTALKEYTVGVFNVLIGYNDVAIEGDFTWHSGAESDYTNWNIDEPNNSGAGGGSENYTVMLGNGFWNDVEGIVTTNYLFEIDFELLQTEGLSSGSAFPLGATTNTFETTDAAGNSASCQFQITVQEGTNSVQDQQLSKGITCAPNPASDHITIQNDSGISLESISIQDINGSTINLIKMNSSETTQTLDISNLNPGIYLLKIEGETGTATKKIVKL